MNKVKAAFTAIVLTTGSVASCAAADMPTANAFAPLELRAARIENARLVCNAFGRCFRVGPYRRFYGQNEFYLGPPVYAPPRFDGGPEYEVRRSYQERHFDAPDYDYRRSEEYHRRSYGDHRYDVPADEYRRSHEGRHSDEESQREERSDEYRRSEGGEERD